MDEYKVQKKPRKGQLNEEIHDLQRNTKKPPKIEKLYTHLSIILV